MKITPMDISHKKFNTAFRGLNPQEVKDFLEEVSGALEEYLRERAGLLAEIDTMRKTLEKYHNIEETLQSTMMLAQKTSDEAISNAKREAVLIIEEARHKVSSQHEEFSKIKNEKGRFLIEYTNLLKSYLEQAQKMSENLDKVHEP